MKFETIEAITKDGLIEHLRNEVEVNHKITRNGNRHGGIRAVARNLQVHEGEISMILNGGRTPSRKVLDYFGLQARTVYERQEQPKESR